MAIGCRIKTHIDRPDRSLVEAFRGIPVANIDDCMNRMAAVDAGLNPLNSSPLLGTAFTVRCPAGDNLMFHKALDLAQPGDVLVIAAGGSMSRALCGEIMVTYARSRGLAGFIIDGCVRDKDELAALTDFPVYARGSVVATARGRIMEESTNGMIQFGGVQVRPGDGVLADRSGVVIIPAEHLEEVIARAEALFRKEEDMVADLRGGMSSLEVDQKYNYEKMLQK